MTTLKWTGTTTFTDGSAFTQANLKGYEFAIDGQPAVGIPLGWDNDNQYEFDISSAVPAEPGKKSTHSVVMYTVGQLDDALKTVVTSDPTPPVSFVVDKRIPNPPTAVAVITG